MVIADWVFAVLLSLMIATLIILTYLSSLTLQNWREKKETFTHPDTLYFKYKAAEADANSLKAALEVEKKALEDFKKRTKVLFDFKEAESRFQKQQIESAVKMIAKLKQIRTDQVVIDL